MWKIGIQLLPTKGGPKPGPYQLWWKHHHIPRQRQYLYRQFDNVQNPVEQRYQHSLIKVYVHRHQKLLLLSSNVQV